MSTITCCPKCGYVVPANATGCSACGLQRTSATMPTEIDVAFPESIAIATLRCLKRYAQFSGRAGGMEFWTFFAVRYVFFGIIYILVSHAAAFLSLAVTAVAYWASAARPLNDTGKGAWNLVWLFTPVAPYVWYLASLPSDRLTNDAGPLDPLVKENA